MKKFKEFINEQDIADEIESSQSYKIKKEFSEIINIALQWIPTAFDEMEIDEIKNKVALLTRDIEDLNMDLKNEIQSKSTLIKYKSIYKNFIDSAQTFEDPPANLVAVLENLNKSLSDLHVFIQSQITT